jgi:hypothetical protein
MKPVTLIMTIALWWAGVAANAHARGLVRNPNEPDLAFAERALHVSADNNPHVVATKWNGVPTLFVDYRERTGHETDRLIVALMRQPDGDYRLVHVTVGEEEGGWATLKAIGFADADRSGGEALITIVAWDQNHHGLLSGTLYDVRIFAPPRSSRHAKRTRKSA